VSHAAVLHRQHDAQSARGAVLRGEDDQRRKASADGPIKTFPLRGIKDSPPYLHDDRLLTLEDTVEFFNLVLGVKLSDTEKADLVAFLRTL
jgi:cytochrome c peroxidase